MELSFKTKNSPVKSNQVDVIGIYEPSNKEAFKGIVVTKPIKFPKELGEMHPFDYVELEGVYKKFGMVTGVVDKYVDYVVGNGFFVKSDNEKAKKIIEDFMEKNEFQTILRAWVKEAIIKGTGFLELGAGKNNAISEMKVLNANYMYVQRDNMGKVTGYNQFIGNVNNFNMNKVVAFKPNEIAQFNINLVGDDAYGQGKVSSNLKTVNNLIGLQKDMHLLMSRKANVPIHAKVGSESQPASPAAVTAFGKSMESMKNNQEWTTDHLVDIKVLDFGKVGEKFDSAINYDLDQLFFGFQVPEVLMGRGRVPEGLAEIQMEGWKLVCGSIQEDLERVIEQTIFTRVLASNGIVANVEMEWGQPSNKEVTDKITALTALISSMTISPGFRAQLELQLAELLGLDCDAIDKTNSENKAKQQEVTAPQPQLPGQNRQSLNPIPIMINQEYVHVHSKNCNHIQESLNEFNDKPIKEWLDFNYQDYLNYIIQAVNKDPFVNLAADTKAQQKLGMLSTKQVNELRTVLKDGFLNNKSLLEISSAISSDVKIKDLFDAEGNLLSTADTRAMMIARTETTRLSAIGSKDAAIDVGATEYTWVASMGSRTCEDCDALNGTIYEMSDGNADMPPLHPGCRCTVVGVNTKG